MGEETIIAALMHAIDREDRSGVREIIRDYRGLLAVGDLNAAAKRVMMNTTGDPGDRITILKRLLDAGATV